ncbi:AIF_collapsed_G0031910.mRNA.1.CDS.1 [Saccharomyces cerevisiae]|nr:AIF_collapsed_G0031910.mRNA.1.CDS.1 [Saccharomyces cerevisiae]
MGNNALNFRPLKNEEEYNNKFIAKFSCNLYCGRIWSHVSVGVGIVEMTAVIGKYRTKGLILIEGENPIARVIHMSATPTMSFPGKYDGSNKECKLC